MCERLQAAPKAGEARAAAHHRVGRDKPPPAVPRKGRGARSERGPGWPCGRPSADPRFHACTGPSGRRQGWGWGPVPLRPGMALCPVTPSIPGAQLQVVSDLSQGEAHSPQVNLLPQISKTGTATPTQGRAHSHTRTCTWRTHLSTYMHTCRGAHADVFVHTCTRTHTIPRSQ